MLLVVPQWQNPQWNTASTASLTVFMDELDCIWLFGMNTSSNVAALALPKWPLEDNIYWNKWFLSSGSLSSYFTKGLHLALCSHFQSQHHSYFPAQHSPQTAKSVWVVIACAWSTETLEFLLTAYMKEIMRNKPCFLCVIKVTTIATKVSSRHPQSQQWLTSRKIRYVDDLTACCSQKREALLHFSLWPFAPSLSPAPRRIPPCPFAGIYQTLLTDNSAH